ncbi:hypothetical protein PENTCL1PPCAC_1806, partial [Pristionchus entomophagus]
SSSYSLDNSSVYRNQSSSLINNIIIFSFSIFILLVDSSFSFSFSFSFPSFSIPSPLPRHSRHTHRTLLPKAVELAGLSSHQVLAGARKVTPTISASLTEKVRCVQRRGVPSYSNPNLITI